MSIKKIKEILDNNGAIKISREDIENNMKKYNIELLDAEDDSYELTAHFSVPGVPHKEQVLAIRELFKDVDGFSGVENPKDLIFVFSFTRPVELI